jgi:hypothetical protein
MVRQLLIALASFLLIISFSRNSSAHKVEYFDGENFLDLSGSDGIIYSKSHPQSEAEKNKKRICDSIRKEIKKLSKTLDSMKRSVAHELDLQDLHVDDFMESITPPNFVLPDLKNPADNFYKLLPSPWNIPPNEDSRMPKYHGPKMRQPKESKPLPDFPTWHIELLKDICSKV